MIVSRDKPTVDQFVSMNRGINDGGDLPRELLASLFDSIKTEPFKVSLLEAYKSSGKGNNYYGFRFEMSFRYQ